MCLSSNEFSEHEHFYQEEISGDASDRADECDVEISAENRNEDVDETNESEFEKLINVAAEVDSNVITSVINVF